MRLRKHLEKKAKKKFLPMQDGDVLRTYADLSKSERLLGYKPKVTIKERLKRFCNWFWIIKISR